MNILGISCFQHDASACLLRDGEIVAAAEEERFDRRRGSIGFPKQAINACLQTNDLTILDVDYIAFYEKPFLAFGRALTEHIRSFPFSFRSFLRTMPRWLSERLVLPVLLKTELSYTNPTLFVKHHLAHAAAAYLLSPFDEAAILVADGVGEWATMSWGTGRGGTLTVRQEIASPDSLGLIFAAITDFLGFVPLRDEGKVEALAATGEPTLLDRFHDIVHVAADGSFRIRPGYFGFCHGRRLYRRKFLKRFGPNRAPDSPIEPHHRELAASAQRLVEEIVLAAARHVHAATGLDDLCLGGGVAHNTVSNARLVAEGPFRRVFVPPAPGSAGAALGAAAYTHSSLLGGGRPRPLTTAALGIAYSERRVRRAIDNAGLAARALAPTRLAATASDRLAAGGIVAWYDGRNDFGPAALGHRGVLADPRDAEMSATVNESVLRRERFLPLSSSVLAEAAERYFEGPLPGAWPLFAQLVREARRSEIPAAVDHDGRCRAQPIAADDHGPLASLLRAFYERTGVPLLLHSPLQVGDAPTVQTPEEACAAFADAPIDAMVMGSFLVERKRGNKG